MWTISFSPPRRIKIEIFRFLSIPEIAIITLFNFETILRIGFITHIPTKAVSMSGWRIGRSPYVATFPPASVEWQYQLRTNQLSTLSARIDAMLD